MTQYKHLGSNIGLSLVGLIYNRGGATEVDGNRGISHLMEHLMCKTFDDLRPKMRRLGIKYNAFTSDNRVVFWWEGLDEELGQMKSMLVDRITDKLSRNMWTEESFLNERSTVLQEYADTFNDQFEGLYYNAMRRYYRIGGPIGVKADIENFTFEDSLKEVYDFAIPDILVEVGPQHDWHKFFFPSTPPVRTPTTLEFKDGGITEELVPKEDKTIVGLLGKEPISKDVYAKVAFLLGCLNSGLGSPLHQEIREKRGLSYYSVGWPCLIGETFVPFFASSTTNDRAEELADVYREFFTGDMSRHVSRERFEICHADMLISEKKDKLLPHEGVSRLVINEINPYEALRNISYDELMAIGSNQIFLRGMEKLRFLGNPHSYQLI